MPEDPHLFVFYFFIPPPPFGILLEGWLVVGNTVRLGLRKNKAVTFRCKGVTSAISREANIFLFLYYVLRSF